MCIKYPKGYNGTIFIVNRTEEFSQWLDSLKDKVTKAKLIRRLQKVEHGLLGDVGPVGDGVSEMREHFGPGWRMYYVMQGTTLVLMLGGGEKSTQERDIERAKALALELQNEQNQDPAV